MDAELPNRQSIRKRGWNYATPGRYFVTINTHQGHALFGVIVNGQMVLNDAGRVAEAEWQKSATIRQGIELDEFVVMPNHVHGIVRLKGFGAPNPYMMPSPYPQFGKPIAGALGTFVGAYKAAVTRTIGRGLVRTGLMHQTPPIAAGASAIWHLNPNGMLACILSEVTPEKEIIYL